MEVTPDNVATDPENFHLLESAAVVPTAAEPLSEPKQDAHEPAEQPQERPEDSKYIAQFDNVKAALANAASAVATCDRASDDENRVRTLIAAVKSLSVALSQQYALSVMQHNYFNDV
jgi:hypothetical protein